MPIWWHSLLGHAVLTDRLSGCMTGATALSPCQTLHYAYLKASGSTCSGHLLLPAGQEPAVDGVCCLAVVLPRFPAPALSALKWYDVLLPPFTHVLCGYSQCPGST